MHSKQLISALVSLGQYMRSSEPVWLDVKSRAEQQNAWFTQDNINYCLENWATLLQEETLSAWLQGYTFSQPEQPKRVGIVMAGNIPMVGFHDLLCTLLSGHKAYIKLSSDDTELLKHLLAELIKMAPELAEQIEFADRLLKIDAVIATGSNNTHRYFEYYFGRYPSILRKNRNSVAILNGTESPEQIHRLGADIFRYYGLGCRSVSKLYIPRGFEIDRFFAPMLPYAHVIDHHKYANNYTYHRAVYLMNLVKFLDNNFLILKEDKALASPVSVLYYEYYHDLDTLMEELSTRKEDIQCIVSEDPRISQAVPFGSSQQPALNDYADDKDTMSFLLGL